MYDTVDIPDTHAEAADEWRGKLLETVAENDEEMMELYLEGEEPSVEQLYAAIRRITIASGVGGGTTVTPVFCGTAFKNKGVQPLLDAVVRYLPSPIDVEAVEGHSVKDPDEVIKRRPSEEEPLSALAFKIASDPHLGKLTFIRVYSGRMTAGTQVLNSVKGKKERIGKIYRMHANKREEIESVGAGDIVAVMGLKQTTTGETLCDASNPVILESMDFPAPVIEVAIEPKSKGDQEKLGVAIQRLAEEDPSFRVKTDEETGQTIIAGMGELHLDVLVDRMKREFKVEANVGKPQVAYRETLRKAVERYDYTHKKQTGGSGQFAKVQIALEPLEGDGYEFENKVTGGRIPREYIPSVDAGCQEAMEFGVLAGYPLTGVKVVLLDGGYHEVDSSEMAFKIAGSMAFKEAARKASPALLEPMMKVEVTTPEDYMGDVIGDINSRRGQIQSMEDRSGAKLVIGLVPLSEMFGYVGRPAQQDLWPRQLLHAVRLLRRGSPERRRGDHREGQGRVRRVHPHSSPFRLEQKASGYAVTERSKRRFAAGPLTPAPHSEYGDGHPLGVLAGSVRPPEHVRKARMRYRTTPQEDPSGEGEVRAD